MILIFHSLRLLALLLLLLSRLEERSALRKQFVRFNSRHPTHIYQVCAIDSKIDSLKALSKRAKYESTDSISSELNKLTYGPGEILTLKHAMVIINIYKHLGQLDKACDVIEKLIEHGVTPDAGIYNNILDGCAQQLNVTLTEGILDLMSARGVSRDSRSYTAVISVFSRTGHWEKAVEMLHIMIDNGVIPDTICYSAVITACAKRGRIKEALELLLQMKENAVPIDGIIYNSVISACSKTGSVEIALQLLQHMHRYNIERDTYVSENFCFH